MIANITTGADAVGLARYLLGPGRETPHTYYDDRGRLREGGRWIGGTVADGRDPLRWARDLDRAAAANHSVQRPIWHASLRAAPGDRRLSDGEWAAIAQQTAEQMGYAEYPWAAVRHDGDHIHIAVSRVDFHGQVWKNSHDRWRITEAMRQVEHTHQLTPVAAPDQARGRGPTSGERRQAQRTEQAPARTVLREITQAAREVTAGHGAEAFEHAVTQNPLGVEVQLRRNEASTGRMNGYALHLDGDTDTHGEPIWWPTSKLDRALSWTRLQEVLNGPTPDRIAPEQQVPRGTLERRSSWEARRRQAGDQTHREATWGQADEQIAAAAGVTGTTAATKWTQVRNQFDRQHAQDGRARQAAHSLAAAFPTSPAEATHKPRPGKRDPEDSPHPPAPGQRPDRGFER